MHLLFAWWSHRLRASSDRQGDVDQPSEPGRLRPQAL